MSIIINIDVMLARRKMSVTELSERVGITMANISILKNGKAKAIKLSTLNSICKALNCQPGDILEYVEDEDDDAFDRVREWIGSSAACICCLAMDLFGCSRTVLLHGACLFTPFFMQQWCCCMPGLWESVL